MSRYELDKALWEWIGRPEARAALAEDPAQFFSGRDLTEPERRAIEDGDIRALYELGTIPFLIYQFALGRAGGVSLDFLRQYTATLAGCEPVEIST